MMTDTELANAVRSELLNAFRDAGIRSGDSTNPRLAWEAFLAFANRHLAPDGREPQYDHVLIDGTPGTTELHLSRLTSFEDLEGDAVEIRAIANLEIGGMAGFETSFLIEGSLGSPEGPINDENPPALTSLLPDALAGPFGQVLRGPSCVVTLEANL